jgi:hypothetical protein
LPLTCLMLLFFACLKLSLFVQCHYSFCNIKNQNWRNKIYKYVKTNFEN